MPSRQQQSRVTLVVDGVNCGQWDDKTGGDVDSNSVQYFLGSGGPRISLGGTTQVNNVVLQTLETDFVLGIAKFLQGRAGKGRAVVTQQKLDDEGNPIHEPFQWTGRLKRAKLADVQSQANAASQFECEIEVDGQVA